MEESWDREVNLKVEEKETPKRTARGVFSSHKRARSFCNDELQVLSEGLIVKDSGEEDKSCIYSTPISRAKNSRIGDIIDLQIVKQKNELENPGLMILHTEELDPPKNKPFVRDLLPSLRLPSGNFSPFGVKGTSNCERLELDPSSQLIRTHSD